MANSYVEYTTAGSSQTTFTAPPKFLSINDIRIKGYNGSTWTELTISARGTTTVTLSASPTAYSKIRVFRSSTTEALVDFQNGSRLAESDLDTAYRQSLFVAQEVAEDADPEGGSGIGNIVNSQLAGGIADSKLASGVGTSANNLVKLDGTAKLPAVDGSQLTNVGGVLEADMFRLTADTANDTDADITANLERVDDATFSKIGTGMTESSGIFTFPSTGLYQVICNPTVIAVSDNAAAVITNVSSDSGGAFDEVALATGGGGGSSFDTNSVYSCAFVNVTNASTFKVKFTTSSMGTNSRLVGDSNRNRTSFSFIKLGASQ